MDGGGIAERLQHGIGLEYLALDQRLLVRLLGQELHDQLGRFRLARA